MNDESTEYYEAMESDIYPFPLRSRLYHLPPIGIGTELAEAQTSYVTRLASAHSVNVFQLIRKEIIPVIGRQSLQDALDRGSGRPLGRPHSFNSWNKMGTDFICSLEKLTQRKDLRYLTMLPWKELLYGGQRLFKKHKEWCPLCFEDWRKKGKVIYEPLLWFLSAVKYCLMHHVQLQHTCPNCSSPQSLLTAYSLPGYCHSCNHWLGSEGTSVKAAAKPISNFDLWTVRNIGLLIASAPDSVAPLSRKLLTGSLSKFITEVKRRSTTSKFARSLHVHKSTVKKWCRGKHFMEFGNILKISYVTETPLPELLTKGALYPYLDTKSLEEYYQSSKKKISSKVFKFDEVKEKLTQIVTGYESSSYKPSVTKV